MGGMSMEMEEMNLWALCMAAVVVSFLGFAVENLWLCVTKGYMDNRNMCLPFLMGYGMAMLGILILLGTPQRPCFLGRALPVEGRRMRQICYFAGSMLCVCVGEIALGKFVEVTCHFYWWDYSQIPLHITRYTSVPTSILFACAITVFMDRVLEPLYGYFLSWNTTALCAAVTVMMLMQTGDFLYNAGLMYKRQGMVQRWRIDIQFWDSIDLRKACFTGSASNSQIRAEDESRS